jgi:hypothetical protein
MEFYSVIKKNVILLFAGKWMELENIILSQVLVAHTYNPSYPGGRDQEDRGSEPA